MKRYFNSPRELADLILEDIGCYITDDEAEAECTDKYFVDVAMVRAGLIADIEDERYDDDGQEKEPGEDFSEFCDRHGIEYK
ncbi:hypothetical protein FACS1894216_04900 [Synergistales bacterium]|nr:hypothetical protein FACS1894216_04900 [Synergistales bacterium]